MGGGERFRNTGSDVNLYVVPSIPHQEIVSRMHLLQEQIISDLDAVHACAGYASTHRATEHSKPLTRLHLKDYLFHSSELEYFKLPLISSTITIPFV